MFYRLTVYLNLFINLILICFACITFFSQNKTAQTDFIFLVLILSVFILLAAQSLLCIQLTRSNSHEIMLQPGRKAYGKALTIIALIIAIGLLIIAALSLYQYFFVMKLTKRSVVIGYLITIILFFLLGVFTIINSRYYFTQLKINSQLVNKFVNNIGQTV
jgi:small-conductance mechanosensitive channel